MSKIIGIDLGTTNSCVAVLEGGEPVVIANAEGARTTPSVVAFSKTGERMVGQVAKRQAVTNADRTIASIKRHMGENYKVGIDGKNYTPQEISAMILTKLKQECEKAKIELSGTTAATINLPFITADATGPKHLEQTITRAKFDELTADLVQATITPMEKALKDAGLTYNDISKVILVGGSTRIPAVQAAVKRVTGKEPFKGINPDECVALGAAIQGGVLGGEVKDVLLLDVTPLSLGIFQLDLIIVCHSNS